MNTNETTHGSDPRATQSNGNLDQIAYTTKETATLLKVSNKTIYRLCSRGVLKRAVALRTLRISRDSILDFLGSQAAN